MNTKTQRRNYKVIWEHGHTVEETTDSVDDWEIFRTFREAKNSAKEKQTQEINHAKARLKILYSLRQRDL